MGATLSYADYLVAQNPADQSRRSSPDLFCREARRRIEGNFKAVKSNFNRSYDKVSRLLMEGKLDWLAAARSTRSRRSTATGEERLRSPG